MEGRFPPNPRGSLDPAAILQQDGIRKQGGYGWGREEESPGRNGLITPFIQPGEEWMGLIFSAFFSL